MGEFVEVCRQWHRLCHHEMFEKKTNCFECPMCMTNNGTHLTCKEFCMKYSAEAEKLIMEWAKEHPEPVYPTWEEWYNKTFPDRDTYGTVCTKWFAHYKCDGVTCSECNKRPIPADIAAKLGIKPKEE